MAEKDKLVDQTIQHKDPYKAKGEDFKVKLSGAVGDKSGQDELFAQSEFQESPRAVESASKNGPSEWGKGGKSFSVGQSKEGEDVSEPCGVDLEGGSVTCKGYSKTKAGEVPDPKVSLK